MNTADKNNSVLSISSRKIKDCSEVLLYMYKLGIPCSITTTKNVTKFNDKIKLEKGCRILFNSHEPNMINKQFWSNLKNKFDLQCAHLNVQGKYKGCINNYFNEIDCTKLN